MSIQHCIPKIRLYTSWSNHELLKPWTQLSTRYRFTLAIRYNTFHWKYYIDKKDSINNANKVYGFVAYRITTVIQLLLAVLNDLQHKVIKAYLLCCFSRWKLNMYKAFRPPFMICMWMKISNSSTFFEKIFPEQSWN